MSRQRKGDPQRDVAEPPAPRAVYRALFENSDLACYVIAVQPDGSFRFEDANDAVAPFLSRPVDEIAGRGIRDCLIPDVADCLEENLRQCLESGGVHSYERSVEMPQGQMSWSTTLTPIVDHEGRIGHVVGMTRDLTLERRLLSAVGQRASMMEGIHATSPGLIYLFDIRARCNRYVGGTSPLGYDPGEFAQMGSRLVPELVHPDDLDGVERHLWKLARLGDGEVASNEYRMRHKEGHYLHCLSRDTVFSRDAAGAVELILGIAVDISEQKGMERTVRRLVDQMVTVRREERRRIAQDLHDSTAQHLIAAELALIRVQAAYAGGEGGSASASVSVDEALGDVMSEIKEAEREIRVLSFLLHPPSIEQRGIADPIRSLALGFGSRAELDVRAEIASAADSLPDEIGIAMFRVCQEALTNVHRHARAKSVSVTLEMDEMSVSLVVADDGTGFDGTKRALTTGIGLAGMRERLERLGGSLEVRCGPGTRVIASVPRAAAAVETPRLNPA